jgi:peptidoglycan hydrolase-like protein with peptidoglycan-binding domain
MNPKLLIVDDDDEIRTQMKWALAKDYEILIAENRTGAVETFQAQQPAVVLLDLGLPPQPGNPEEGLVGESMKLLQHKLAALGHDVGKIDGILGSGTREAVRKEQMRLGLPVDGWPTPALLANL